MKMTHILKSAALVALGLALFSCSKKEELKEAFGEILAFAGKCDSYNIDVILKELQNFRIPHEEQERFNALLEAASNFDFERIKVILSK